MSKSKKHNRSRKYYFQLWCRFSKTFILSDSPPEKDVQWSDEGINSSFRFIQKLWNLNTNILDEIKKDHKENSGNLFEKTNLFLKNITKNLENLVTTK